MNTRDLIDGIVQQTTVLIAQISTAAGIRAPLAHLADQVFLELAREIESQGVGRKSTALRFTACSGACAMKSTSSWNEVTEYNNAHPVNDAARVRVYFYFGQTVEQTDARVEADGGKSE